MIAAWPGLRWRRVGLGVPRPGWVRPSHHPGGVRLPRGAAQCSCTLGQPERGGSAVQATVPGLQEELLPRGAARPACPALPGAPAAAGRSVEWGLPLTTVLFAFVRGVGLVAGQVVLNMCFVGLARRSPKEHRGCLPSRPRGVVEVPPMSTKPYGFMPPLWCGGSGTRRSSPFREEPGDMWGGVRTAHVDATDPVTTDVTSSSAASGRTWSDRRWRRHNIDTAARTIHPTMPASPARCITGGSAASPT